MSESSSTLRCLLLQFSEPITECLSSTPYSPHQISNISIKPIIESLLPSKIPPPNSSIHGSMRDFALACALLSSSTFKPITPDYSDFLSWIPNHLSQLASSTFLDFSKAYLNVFSDRNSKKVSELGLNCELIPQEKRLVLELMPEVLPLLKDKIKESSIDMSDESDEFSAASARVPVGFAIAAAYQLRWFVTQVAYPHIGKLCGLVIPCALTAVDHWSPEVKGQGFISLTHLGKNVDTAELSWCGDVILDACCQNMAACDDVWHLVVEASVLIISSTQRSNPRSPWFERMLNEMLSHLERQPRNKERRIAWLQSVDPLLKGAGLVLLAHFRRIFPLFFQWIHADDDDTLKLALKRTCTVLRVTWIRHSPYIDRLVDKLAVVYKEAALRRAREDIRADIRQILILLQESKGMQFETAWEKHRLDPDLTALGPPLSGRDTANPDSTPSKHCHLSDHQQGSPPLPTQ